MILLFDIGNTRIKYAELNDGRLLVGKEASYNDGMVLDTLLSGIGDTPTAVYLASVGDKTITKQLIRYCHSRWELTPTELSSAQECAGVLNGYSRADTLGVDRWAAMVGAYQLVKAAVLVIDCGTACTADLVDAEGHHRGGAIIPGMQMMRDSLTAGTKGISMQDYGRSSEAVKTFGWGVNTTECIELGVSSTLIAFIEAMTAQACATLGEDGVQVLLTGGDAPKLLPLLKASVRHEKELVFCGMASMVKQKGE